MKFTRTNFVRFYIFLFLILNFLHFSNGDNPSDECVDLIWEMRNCSTKLHFPEKCEPNKQSDLVTCAEAVASKLPSCPDEIAQKMINHYVNTYKMSDQVVCLDETHEELINNKNCVSITKVVVISLAHFTPGFLTERGCKFFKTFVYVVALTKERYKCFDVVKDYIDVMYSKSDCGKFEIDMPGMNDFNNFKDVVQNIVLCWVLHTKVPNCNKTIEKSRRLQCVEDEVMNKIKNRHLKTYEDNILLVSEKTDSILCENQNLRDDFKSNRQCLTYTRPLGLFLSAEVNGYFTEEGCEGLKYREKYKLALVSSKCRPILNDYWKAMKKVLPCVPELFTSSGNVKNLLVFVLITSIITIEFVKILL